MVLKITLSIEVSNRQSVLLNWCMYIYVCVISIHCSNSGGAGSIFCGFFMVFYHASSVRVFVFQHWNEKHMDNIGT